MSIDEVASAIAPQFGSVGSGEPIRAAVRRQFLLAAPDCSGYNPDERNAFANFVTAFQPGQNIRINADRDLPFPGTK